MRNGTVYSVVTAKDPFSTIFPHRIPSVRPNVEEGFMICECQFDISIHLGVFFTFWRAPDAQNVDNLNQCHLESWRDKKLHTVGTRLALCSQSLKKESYGRYTCVLDYLGTGRVEWNVYLNAAPILILPLIPPPPPLLKSGLANPRCLQGSAAANLTEQWHHACEVLAYPQVVPSHHV